MEHIGTQGPISQSEIDRFISEADASKERTRIPAEALEQLGTDETIALIRFARDHEHSKGFVGRLEDGVDGAVTDLFKLNIERSRELMNALAESDLEVNREDAAWWVCQLTKQDRDFGLPLWHRLARDSSMDVRHAAVDCLGGPLSNPDEPWDDDLLENYGITWDEAMALRATKEQADHDQLASRQAAAVKLIAVLSRGQADHPPEPSTPHQ